MPQHEVVPFDVPMPSNKPLRVLIVEDVPADAWMIRKELSRAGYTVEWSRVEGEVAYRAALNPRLDVILSDCKMPGFTSGRALKVLRDSGLDVPFILVSGTIGEEAAAELMRQGAADFIPKDKRGRLGMAVERAMAEAKLRRERLDAIESLRSAEALYRGLFENSVDGIFQSNPDGRVVMANAAYLRILEVASIDQLGDRTFDHGLLEPHRTELAERLQFDGRVHGFECRCQLGSGVLLWLNMSVRRVIGPDGSVAYYEGSVQDATSRKLAETALIRSESQLERAINQLRLTQESVIAKERLHALGEMSSGIAHDFNNSLSPIVGLSDLLITYPNLLADHDKALKFLQTINQAGRDAAKVVSRLRDFYRPADDVHEIEVFSLKQVVEQAIEFTQPRWGDQAMATDTKYKIVTSLKDVRVAGQPSEMREMLVNLIFNALDAMPLGGELAITIDGVSNQPEKIRLEVKDTGVGMTAEVRRRCLEPFFTTKGAHGTGLGLATSFGIAKRHHGEIEIESEPGHGTRVIVTLPPAAEVSPNEKTSGLPPHSTARSLRILVIDDEAVVRDVIAEYLQADGHHADLADGGASGLGWINSGAYDLIITDRAMPDMSGEHLALEAKRIAPQTPILMLTGFGEIMNGAGERPAGVDAVASKPITIRALREVVGRLTLSPSSTSLAVGVV
jgi:PAS domain S-box-containing protein